MGAESERVAGFGRMEDGLRQAGDWYRWGPYVSERQWGTVREDYSPDGEAWDYLPHDHARSRAYRWGEDGLAGFCDIEQRLCLGLALWNGRDPILKERAFGLTGSQGNHGEDVKEYWWYLDAVPSHAWNRWRYHYPQAAYPYQDLIDTNRSRNRYQPEYELVDTGIFDADRYWIVEVHYAKADPDDLLMKISVTNAGPDADTLHVLPTAWFRNTWSWEIDAPKPAMAASGDTSAGIEHPWLGSLELLADSGPDGAEPVALFCENETNLKRLYGVEPITPYPKDGINDHVVSGAPTVNPQRTGTKCAFWYKVTVQPGQTAELRLRLWLRPAKTTESGRTAAAFGTGFDEAMAQRQAEADEFYAELTPEDATADEGMVMRQAFGGLLWSKQLFYYDVARWLDGDPPQPTPPYQRLGGRNSRWRNFKAFDIMSMPDKWEYPWFAAWDLAFHCVALAHVDPAFAKYQLILLCREWFQNAYCQDNEITWFDWSAQDTALLAFTRQLIALRTAHPVFRRNRFLAGAEASELRWFTPAATEMTGADWSDPNALAVALYLDGSDDPDRAADGTWLIDDDFLVLVNAWWEPLDFVLPDTRPQAGWQTEIDTHDPVSQADPATAERKAGDHITVGPRSVVVLKNLRPPEITGDATT